MQENKTQLVSDIKNALRSVSGEISQRNNYINELDSKIYENGLYDGLTFPIDSDKTLYNYLKRIVDIHTSQLMGRGFSAYSSYNMEDLSLIDLQPNQDGKIEEQKSLAELKNKQKKTNADTRKKVLDAIIRDNGGQVIFEDGAEIGSSTGTTIYKLYPDVKEKKVRITLIETVQNFYSGWKNSNFRERDWDAYVYQISLDEAMRLYGSKLAEGEVFTTTKLGDPLMDPVKNIPEAENARQMVTVIDFTGFLAQWGVKGKSVTPVDRGKEAKMSVLVVGDKVVQEITDKKYLPSYYIIQNKRIPRRPWGVSDVTPEAVDINRTILEVMSTWVTLYHKEVGATYLAKNFEPSKLPKRKPRTSNFVPMGPDQSIELLNSPSNWGPNSQQLIAKLEDALVRVTGIGRVLFDDPSVNTGSNQALLTTMKGAIDIVDRKKKRWEPVLTEMFKDALELAVVLEPKLKEEILEDASWNIRVEWPSALRKEDAAYQQMQLTRFQSGLMSVGSYMESMGDDDSSEEIDRIQDEMRNPVTAAIIGRQLPALAQQVVSPAPQGPPAPQVKYNVNVKADASTDPNQNMQVIEEVMGNPEPAPDMGPEMSSEGGETPPNASLTPDQNQEGQAPSMPGSGQPAPVTPEGSVAQVNQRNGA